MNHQLTTATEDSPSRLAETSTPAQATPRGSRRLCHNKSHCALLLLFGSLLVLQLVQFSQEAKLLLLPAFQLFQEAPYNRKFGDNDIAKDVLADTLSSQQQLQQHYDVCIAGAGLSGAVLAERYATQQHATVLVLEKRNHIAGNCYDYEDEETGIRVSKYGAHLFHTQYDDVWQYVQQFGEWARYEHEVTGIVNDKVVPIPVNIDTVNILFDLNITTTQEMDAWLAHEQVKFEHPVNNSEQVALSRVGPRLYELIFKPYTFKQWAKYPAQLGPEVLSRIPVRNNWDRRYFSDPHQALPVHGYTALFDNMLNHPNITVKLNIDYLQQRPYLNCGRTYYTGPIDTYFSDTGWPKLEYRSLEFERHVEHDIGDDGFFQPNFVVNHPQDHQDDYTRIVEYKHLMKVYRQGTTTTTTTTSLPHTVYFIERSKDGGEPYYPVPNQKNQDLYKKYQEMADQEASRNNITFVGRLANYKYFNMDQAIKNALDLYQKEREHPLLQQVVKPWCNTKQSRFCKRDTFRKYAPRLFFSEGPYSAVCETNHLCTRWNMACFQSAPTMTCSQSAQRREDLDLNGNNSSRGKRFLP